MVRLTDGSVRARVALAADLLALAAFVVVGVRSHHGATQLRAFLRNAVPFGGVWLVTAALVGTYRPPSTIRLAKTWLIAVPAGVVVWSLWVGSEGTTKILIFLVVAMAFTLVFLIVGRFVTARFRRRRFV
jgi:hypothetical protein